MFVTPPFVCLFPLPIEVNPKRYALVVDFHTRPYYTGMKEIEQALWARKLLGTSHLI